ncbi:MAG: extracellular solute-binding protein [Lachnospiraceae bacterium]|nr:extracellular solute-binding protein [Lachnospiraceae bacterium]
MKKSSRLLAALLAAGMTLSMVACGDKDVVSSETNNQETQQTVASVATEPEEDLYYNKEGYPICDEPITIKVSGIQGNTTDWKNTEMVKYIEENLGIKMECEPYPADAFSAQYALMLSTNSMPDLIINATIDKGQVNMDGEDGYWLDISQYLDIMPNFAAALEENPEWAAYQYAAGGAIYGLNRVNPGELSNASGQIYYNKALVEAVYPDPIETIDDFYEALVAVKAAYPDKIPFAITFDAMPAYRADIILRNAFGIHYNDNSYMLVADENGKVSLGDISDENREYLKWLNKLYDEGLLSKEGFTLTSNEYRAKEDAGEFIFWADTSLRHSQNKISNNVDDYGIIAALSSDMEPETTYILGNGITTNARIFVSAETEYPEAICRLIDFLCTEEGKELATVGVEGVHFEYVDDGYGNMVQKAEAFADLNNYETLSAWQQQKVTIYQGMALFWNYSNNFWDDVDTATAQKMAQDENQYTVFSARQKLALDEVDNVYKAPAPLTYTAEETEERATMYTDLINYLKTSKVSFITGEFDVNDDKAWESHLSKVNDMGYERLMEIEQAAWDRMTANLK